MLRELLMIIEIIKGKINLKNNKISSDPKDWHNVDNILGLANKKIEYPQLKLDDKKATTD